MYQFKFLGKPLAGLFLLASLLLPTWINSAEAQTRFRFTSDGTLLLQKRVTKTRFVRTRRRVTRTVRVARRRTRTVFVARRGRFIPAGQRVRTSFRNRTVYLKKRRTRTRYVRVKRTRTVFGRKRVRTTRFRTIERN